MSLKEKYIKDKFNPELDFTIYNIKKTDTSNNNEYGFPCRDWTLTQSNIHQLLKTKSTATTNSYIHYYFDDLPCIVTTKIKQGNKVFELNINSGSWWNISSLDTTLYFADLNKKHEKLFLSSIFEEDLN